MAKEERWIGLRGEPWFEDRICVRVTWLVQTRGRDQQGEGRVLI